LERTSEYGQTEKTRKKKGMTGRKTKNELKCNTGGRPNRLPIRLGIEEDDLGGVRSVGAKTIGGAI